MTVGELIDQLSRYDDRAKVVVEFEGSILKVMDAGRRERNGMVQPILYARTLAAVEDYPR